MDYIKEPLYVSIVNPIDKNNIRTYYFLGNIPNTVLLAAQSGKFNETSKLMEWNRDNKSILKNFYGNNWESILTGDEPTEMKNGFNLYSNIIWGGDDFGDLSIFDKDIFEISEPEIRKNELDFIGNDLTSKIVYSNVSVYPEDNLYDLRLKIYLITKIPVYRQFMFYYVDNQGPYYTYQISINKIPYNIQWNTINTHKSKLNVGGIGIDAYFEQNRKDIDIISFDPIRLLENKRDHKINKVYIVDLFDMLQNRNIKNIIVDKYQFDLLYYGFIIKYWPQLTPDAFKLVVNDIDKLTTNYPKLDLDFVKLYNNQVLEQQLINKTYKSFDHVKYTMAITQSNIIIHSKMIKMNTNIRNIFDLLELNHTIYAMFINFKQGLRKYYYYSKKHASIMNEELYVINNKNILSICVKGDHQIIINITREGSYEILSHWLEDDLISFDNIVHKLSQYINPVITQINNLGSVVFPMGGTLNLLNDTVFNLLTVSLYYPFTFTLAEFNRLKTVFKQYEDVGIIKSQGIQVSRSFLFTFHKGITDSNFVHESYKWLYEDINTIGRHIRLVYRTDRIQIEMINIKNIMEYEIIKRYMFSAIDNFIKDNKLKKDNKLDESKIKSIRKLHDLDPELYNLNKYSPQTYSVLCQSSRQPIIYNEESNAMNKDKLIKYWNFTHNKPAYYLCNKRYPYINFITDKHPKGYCLPCCKKLPDTPGTKVADINNICIQNKTFKTDVDVSTYILNYGKVINGRLSNIPSELKNIFEKDYYIYGVKQTSNLNTTNIGFISSLKTIFGNDCINDLANLVKDMKQYYVLANGKAGSYKSANELYSDLISNFVNYSNTLLVSIDMNKWIHILTDLVRYKYNVEIITIIKNDSVILNAYQDAYKSIESNINVSFLITDDNGTNPIIHLNHKEYIKTNKYTAVFDSSLCKHFFVVPKKHIMDLTFIMAFAKKHNHEITTLYINMKNMCYGIYMNNIYLPVIDSNIPYKNNINLSYDIRPDPHVSRNDMLKVINDINNYRKDSIVITDNIIFDNKAIGLLSADHLCYYHTSNSGSGSGSGSNIVFDYDPKDIDQSILQRNENDKLSSQALLKKYYNNMYKLFFSEFITILQKDTNNAMRKKIINTIDNTNFMDSKSIQNMIQTLEDTLKKYPSDLNNIHKFIEFIYFNSIDTSEISNFVNVSKFEFDFKLLEELRTLNEKQLIKRLHEIMDPFIEISSVVDIPHHYNIYTSCINNTKQFFCKNCKIMIPENKINDIFEVLANDITNKSKSYLMMLGSSGIFDYLEFIERPYEFIEISDVKDSLI